MESCGLALDETVREELTAIPSIKDFNELSNEDLESKAGVLVLKNKLVMREGEHNGIYYSWDELKEGYLTGEGAGLFYDHDDAVKNYVGIVKNLKLNEEAKGIYGDIHVTDKQAATNLRLGAKWGVSPTIDAEKLIKGGKKYALDPKFVSYSLVLRPAVRETMLNSQNNTTERRLKCMEEKERFELAEKQHEKEIEQKEDEIEELRSANKKYESEELSRKSAEVLGIGKSYGILLDSDLDKLKEMSDVGRSMLSDVIGRVAKTFKLDEEEVEDKKTDEEKAKEAKEAEETEEAKKEDLAATQIRMKEELSQKSNGTDSLNKGMLSFMQKQEKL